MTLIQLWMAHGLIPLSNNGEQLEDIADKCINHLLYRSFFDEVRDYRYGQVLKLKIHDYIMILHYQLQGRTVDLTIWMEKLVMYHFLVAHLLLRL